MSSYASLSLDRVQPLLTKGQVTAATRLYTEQQTELPDDAATVAKQNYDVVTISEEGKAVAQALNAAPVAGASSEGLFLNAAGVSESDGTDYAALKAADEAYNKAAEKAENEAEKRCAAWSRAAQSYNAMMEEMNNVSFGSYDSTTGLYYINFSAFDRYLKTKIWEWQEDLRVNDPDAYEAWVSEFGVKKEPKFSTSSEEDVYRVIDLTPDADGHTELDYVYMKLEQMKSLIALIEEQYRENRKREEEESGEPSAAERLETQNAKLEETLQTNDLEVFEIRLEPPGEKEE